MLSALNRMITRGLEPILTLKQMMSSFQDELKIWTKKKLRTNLKAT